MRNKSQTARRAIRPAEILLRGCRAGNFLPVCAALASLLLVSAVPEASAQDAAAKPATATKPEASAKTGDAVRTNAAAKADAAATQDAGAKQQAEPPTYPDKESGDRARAEMEYGAAASFYRLYRTKAEQAGDVKAQKDAYACELDALILANLADPAQKLLDEYRSKFQLDSKSVSLWQAEICLVRRKADEADQLLQKLIPSLEKLDPGLLRALSCAAFVAELKGDQKQAAEYYGGIAADAGIKTAFGRRAVERQALALAALGKNEEAFNLLNSLPVAENKRDVDALKILSFYLTLSGKGSETLAEEWSEIRSISAPRKDNFFFLAACRIGDEFLRLGETVRAAEAFHLAYGFASVREDALTAMQRLMNAFDVLGQEKEAAELAMRMLSFFKDVQLSPDFKLRIAAILFHAGRTDDALDVCLSCISDAAVENDREKTYRDALDVMIREEAFPSACKFIDAFDTTPEGKAARAMDRAEIAWREKKFADAAKRYRAIGESSAEFRQEALLNAMRCCRDAGQYDEMLDIAALLRQDDPEHPAPDMLLLSAVAQESMSAAAQDESARTELLSAAARNYLDYEAAASKTEANRTAREQALFRAGQLLSNLGRPAEAAPVFRRYCLNYDSAGAARYWLIHCLYASGDEVGAERESWRFIEEKPESQYAGAAMLRLAEHYLGTGSVQHAESTLEQLLSQNRYPKILALATYERALLAFQRDELAVATKYLDRIDVSDPKNAPMAEIHYLRGDIARALNDFARARTEYEAAAKAAAGTRLEQAALGSAADCIYALASAPAVKASAPPTEPSAEKEKKESEEKALTPADNYRKAADAYLSLLKVKNLLPEYRAMAVYKAGQSLWKAGDEQAAFDLFKQLVYLIPAQETAVRPVEAYWAFRAVEALESLAHKEPVIANVESAVAALEWLRQTGTVDQASVRQRIRALRKKQYQPPLPASSSTSTTTPESSQ